MVIEDKKQEKKRIKENIRDSKWRSKVRSKEENKGKWVTDVPRGGFGTVWKPFINIFKLILGWLIVIAGLIVLGLVLVFIFFTVSSGSSDVIFDNLGLQFKESGFYSIFGGGIAGVIDLVTHPEDNLLPDSSYDVEKAEEDIYIKLDKPELDQFYFTGKDHPIKITTFGNSYNFIDESKAMVFCDLDDYDKTEDNVIIDPEELILTKGDDAFTISCNFKEGFESSGKKEVRSHPGEIGVIYKATAQSSWGAYYTYEKNDNNEKIENLGDSKVTNGIRKTEPEYNSPVTLVFDTRGFKQPFYQGRTYNLGVKLVRDATSSGNWEKLDKVCLFVPNNVEISGDDCAFIEAENECQEIELKNIRETDLGKYTIYELKDGVLKEANKDCGNREFRQLLGLTEKECLDYYKGETTSYKCDFEFSGLSRGYRNLELVKFHLAAAYDYKLVRSFVVNVKDLAVEEVVA